MNQEKTVPNDRLGYDLWAKYDLSIKIFDNISDGFFGPKSGWPPDENGNYEYVERLREKYDNSKRKYLTDDKGRTDTNPQSPDR